MPSTISVDEFEETKSSEWDAFVNRSMNGTLMHTRRFLGYHPSHRFMDRSIIFRTEKNQIAAVFPAAEVNDSEVRILKSHPGSSYGGVVVCPRFQQWADEIIEKLIGFARERAFDSIWIRSAERIFSNPQSDDLDSAMFRSGFRIIGRELSSACELDTPETMLARMNENARRNIVLAQRQGIETLVSQDFSSYWQLLHANLHQRHSANPTHSLSEIEQLSQLLQDRLFLVGGYHEKQLVAGVVIFIMNSHAAHTMYIAQDYAFNHLKALNVVVFEALQECYRRGAKYLNFGISTEPGTLGKQINPGLHAFKLRFGAQGIFRDIWEFQINSG